MGPPGKAAGKGKARCQGCQGCKSKLQKRTPGRALRVASPGEDEEAPLPPCRRGLSKRSQRLEVTPPGVSWCWHGIWAQKQGPASVFLAGPSMHGDSTIVSTFKELMSGGRSLQAPIHGLILRSSKPLMGEMCITCALAAMGCSWQDMPVHYCRSRAALLVLSPSFQLRLLCIAAHCLGCEAALGWEFRV